VGAIDGVSRATPSPCTPSPVFSLRGEVSFKVEIPGLVRGPFPSIVRTKAIAVKTVRFPRISLLIGVSRPAVHVINRSVVLGTDVGRREYTSVVRTERCCLRKGTSVVSHRGRSAHSPRTASMTVITRSYRNHDEDRH